MPSSGSAELLRAEHIYYCFDALVAQVTHDSVPAPFFDDGDVSWCVSHG